MYPRSDAVCAVPAVFEISWSVPNPRGAVIVALG